MAKKKESIVSDPGLVVSGRVEIIDVVLLACEAKRHPVINLDKKNEISLSHIAQAQVNKRNKSLHVIIENSLVASHEEQETEDPYLVIKATFLASYRVNSFDGLTEEGYQRFASLNGVFNTWPFWREFVHSTTARLGLPSLTIPVYRIVKRPEISEASRKVAKTKKVKKAKSSKKQIPV